MREIEIKPSVTLPPLNTSLPEVDYPFHSFLQEFVYAAPGMRDSQKSLDVMFQLEEAFEGKQVGDKILLNEDDWRMARDAAKVHLDDAIRTRMPVTYVPKVLRHYHAFASAPEVKG